MKRNVLLFLYFLDLTRARAYIICKMGDVMANLYERIVEPHLNDIKKWSGEGATIKEIAEKLGISYSGLKSYKKKYPELEAALIENRGVADDKVLGAFFRKATGYENKEITKERVNGKLVITKEVTREVAADTEAAKFWLKNRRPDEWKDKNDMGIEIKSSEKLADIFEQIGGEGLEE